MSRDSLLDFYREIVNSKKSFGIDYKNLSKQLIERIDKAIEYIKTTDKWLCRVNDNLCVETIGKDKLLEILGDKK